MRPERKKILRWFGYLLVIVSLSGWLLVTTVDDTDYRQTDFYASTLARKDSLIRVSERQEAVGETLSSGWGRANITPNPPVRLTGKNFKPYSQVFDSVYVRTLLFSEGQQLVAVLNYDLWIIHPNLANYIRKRIQKEMAQVTGIYFTANHSHTSIGGWASGILGELIVGGNNPETLEFIGDQTIESIQRALRRLTPVEIGFGAIATEDMVTNRLDVNGLLDTELRVLKISDSTGNVAVFNTFAAHSVYMDKAINTLSADYPGPFLDYLEKSGGVEFAAFAPGATGSHTPIGRKPFEHTKMLGYSKKLAEYFQRLQAQISTDTTGVLKFFEWPVDLRSAHFRISNRLRFKPWLFDGVMGKYKPRITVLRVGQVVLVGLPVELSGEFYPLFRQDCEKRGLSLVITSFNGWYLGYVNPERYYYSLRRAETREMNWYGPQNGEYFVELVKHILEIV